MQYLYHLQYYKDETNFCNKYEELFISYELGMIWHFRFVNVTYIIKAKINVIRTPAPCTVPR